MANTEILDQALPRESAVVPSAGYKRTRQDVTELLFLEEDEDYTRPSAYAFNQVFGLLEDANWELSSRRQPFPRGVPSASENGGIYLFWREKSFSVQLEIPTAPGGFCYLHTIVAGVSTINRDVSAATLAEALSNHLLSTGD